MNYFQIIDQCFVRNAGSGFKIESPEGQKGYALKSMGDNPPKNATFELEYGSSPEGEVNFVFGSSSLRDKLFKVCLGNEGGKARIKINLKEKIITGNINNKNLYINIESNIRCIKYFGFNLIDASLSVSTPDVEFKKPTPRAKTKASKKPLLITILTKNAEKDIRSKLQKIEKDFKGSNWGLVIADINSSDSTYDIIKSHDSSAKLYHYFRFERGVKERRAKSRLKEFAKSFKNVFPYVIAEELISTRPPHEIQSFCTVVTDKFKIEASIMIKTLKEFHQQPIYIICDDSSKKFLEIEGFKNVHFSCELSEEKLEEVKQDLFLKQFTNINKYHKPECLLYKMKAMDLAFENHDNTFFLDADLVILDSLQENFICDITLSPHFYGEAELDHALKYGFFNAGYIFCANKSFPDYWRDIYLNRSTFFEQEGMNHIIEKYDIQTFSESHNFGFWRKSKPNFKIKSFHVHTVEQEFDGERKLKDANEDTKEILFKYLDKNNKDLKKYIVNSTGKIWGGMDANTNTLTSFASGKINLQEQPVFWHHRSGWNYAIQALLPLHNKEGVLFDGFLEKNFGWGHNENILNNKLPYDKPWVGFFHNPPHIPEWFFYENSLQEIIKKPAVKKSLDNCLGLFALSEHHAKHLRETLKKPVSALIHPSEIPDNIFSYDGFLNNKHKKIVNIGYWLRKLNSIYLLPIKESDGFKKVRLIPYNSAAPKEKIDSLIEEEKKIYNIDVDPRYEDNTVSLERLSDEEYDILLTENIAFLDLYDSSANNAIIECIARATPILVNPIPAVKEYLGESYPFYFENLAEAAEKARDFDLVKKTHHYLLSCETRKKFSQKAFRKSLEESEVYKLL